jgi:hypothetical protein
MQMHRLINRLYLWIDMFANYWCLRRRLRKRKTLRANRFEITENVLEPDWAEIYTGDGSGTTQFTDVAASWTSTVESVSWRCTTCGHVVTVTKDAPIIYGDSRLCEHLGGPPHSNDS